MDQDKFEYWMEGIVLAVFEHIKPEYGKTGTHAVIMMETIDAAKKRPEEKEHWDSLDMYTRLKSIDSAFRRLSRKRTLWTTETDSGGKEVEIKRVIPKKLIRVGTKMGDPLYALFQQDKKKEKVTHMKPSPVSTLTKMDRYKFE